METAFHMQKQAMDTFDISREPEHVREKYGDTVRVKVLSTERSLFGRKFGVGIAGAIGAGFAETMLDALEDESVRARYRI